MQIKTLAKRIAEFKLLFDLDSKESFKVLTAYYGMLIKRGQIVLFWENHLLVGFCEWWRVNRTDFHKLIKNHKFNPLEISSGDHLYMPNFLIRNDKRGIGLINYVRCALRLMHRNGTQFYGWHDQKLNKFQGPFKARMKDGKSNRII